MSGRAGRVIDGIVVRNGRVYDGSGAEPRLCDLLLRQGRIEAIGPNLQAPFADPLDATGLAVSPGFVDLHSHSDLIVALPPERRRALQRGKLLQGITTELSGNCGLGAAPLEGSSAADWKTVVSWMTPAGASWRWDRFDRYLEAVDGAGLPINTGFLAAHGTIRAAVMGLRAGPADSAALDRICGIVADALEAGAFGLSCGLIYPPGMHAPTDELIAAAAPVARAAALFTSHIRGSSETLLPAVAELLEIGRRAGCSVHHSHSEAVGPAHWIKIEAVLETEERARTDGQRVSFDLFPYHAAATMMSAIYPPWALAGGPAALLEKLADPAQRERIRRAVRTQLPAWPPWAEGGWPHNLVAACGYERIFVARTGGRTGGRYDGLSLIELGRARGSDPFDAICDLMIEEEGEVGQWIFGITGDEEHPEPMDALIRSPHGAIATDACDYGTGLPHPSAYGAFPRVLARYARCRGTLTMAEAIRRMTSLPASVMGLTDRGRLAPGLAADIVIFDPAAVADRATFAEPRRPPEGILHVLVNGVRAVTDGEPTGADAGVLLRRQSRL